jgi:hypothetical protein
MEEQQNGSTSDVTVTSQAGTAPLPALFNYLPNVAAYSSSETLTFPLYDPSAPGVPQRRDHIDVFVAAPNNS